MATSTTGKSNPTVDMTDWRRQMQARRIKFDDEQKALYCLYLKETGVKGVAAFRAGVALATVQAHLKNDPDFAEAADMAWNERAELFVPTIEKQALEGHLEKTIHGEGENRVERTRRVFETPLRIGALKKYDADGYAPAVAVPVSTGASGAIMVPVECMSIEEWESLYSPKEVPPPEDESETV